MNRVVIMPLFWIFAAVIFFTGLTPAGAVPSLELYGTFHSMGLIATLTGDDPQSNATARLSYRTGANDFMEGFPLTRVSQDLFVGSLFMLSPGTVYDVRVTFEDPDSPALDNVQVSGSSSTRPEIVIPAPEQVYYASPSGTGSGTLNDPCSLSSGLSKLGPGVKLVLRGGTYPAQAMNIPASGTAQRPIVITAHDGETVTISGRSSETLAWVNSGSGVYRTTINAVNTRFAMAGNKRLFPYASLDDLTQLVHGISGYFLSGDQLYLHLLGNVNPAGVDVAISGANTAFTIEQDYIYLINLGFTLYGSGSWAKAIYINNGSSNLVKGCTFSHNDLGVGIKRNSGRNVIENCEFYDSILDWPWSEIKSMGGYEDGGIRFYSPVDGRGNIIRRNTFHDDFDGFGVSPGSTSLVTNETDVYENTVYNMGDDGVEVDGTASNVRLWKNTFYDILMGISVAPVYKGPVYAFSNLIYRTGVGNHSYTGSPFKFNSGYDKSGAIYLFHNTCDAVYSSNNGLYIKAPGSWDKVYSRNNIYVGTDYAVENYNASQPVDFDYDTLWNHDAAYLVRWDGTRYTTLSAFAAATGHETHGLSADPLFEDPGSGDFRLKKSSTLIDQGVLIPGINHNYKGRAPDPGAFEFGMDAVTHPGIFMLLMD
ncbi:MAG: hypothetical protein D3926_12405 [Desulfobacteraceae bacterium]|nr:MAG: hypothetical protein D3926_12405 [Desulfobacteraceae bacterium]